jgi:hypothetical protein
MSLRRNAANACPMQYIVSFRSLMFIVEGMVDVPAVYLTSAFLWFFSVLLFRRISKLRSINHREGFESHPRLQIFRFVLNEVHCPNSPLV